DKAKKETLLTQENSPERMSAEKNEDIVEASLQSAKKLRDLNKESLEKGIHLSKIEQSLAKEYVSESIVRASRDGKVSTLFVQEGDFARSGESLVRISSLEQSLRVTIPSSQAHSLSLGDSLEIESENKKKSLASIVKIEPHNTVDFLMYTVTFSLSENENWYEGMYVLAHIETDDFLQGLLLDRSALHSFYDDHFVFVVSEENRIKKKKVSIIKEYTEEVLLEGINKEDRIVIASEKDLLSGMIVQIYE
ncbi:MAG: efflux RND transporter periplasmic adaptor subunit, partial [Candidatus Moranbacteria bacterium]|nr:efflux RND transporter periplasmic adaptor subunit [Candidatus Moranbacteria bacterium]